MRIFPLLAVLLALAAPSSAANLYQVQSADRVGQLAVSAQSPAGAREFARQAMEGGESFAPPVRAGASTRTGRRLEYSQRRRHARHEVPEPAAEGDVFGFPKWTLPAVIGGGAALAARNLGGALLLGGLGLAGGVALSRGNLGGFFGGTLGAAAGAAACWGALGVIAGAAVGGAIGSAVGRFLGFRL